MAPKTSDSIATARKVLDNEIAGLNALRDQLGDEYSAMVAILRATKGRIIVTGMGKSGHVARKIASTFSSTGTPAYYVHPGEASHGDLGMITSQDTILALSKSGETAELGDLLGYAKRFSIPVTAISAGTNSSLINLATASIVLPDIAEACTITNAPTTSTTMMIAAGDALAISLMRDKGMTANEFHGFHPGGLLGAALRRVEDLMHKDVGALPLCNENADLNQAITIMNEGGFGCVGILDSSGKLSGILTDGDLRRLFVQSGSRDNNDSPKVAALMTRSPKTVEPDTIAGDALALMNSDKITALFVLKNQKPVGLLHIHDCLASGVV